MPPNKIYFLPFNVYTHFGKDGLNLRVEDARNHTIVDIWNEEIVDLAKESALNMAARMLGYRSYEHIEGK